MPRLRTALLHLSLLLSSTLAVAADDHLQQTPSLEAVPVTGPIVIDGSLDEASWQNAPVVGDFLQREPEELQPATESTEVRAVYSETTLFFAVRAYDRDPSSIVALEMQRDGRLFRDDAIAILLDTFHDHRNVYFFETNPNGARTDGLVRDEGDDFNTDWDGVWSVSSKIDSEGWTAEFAIPFRTLRLNPNLDAWSLQIRRMIRRKNEETFFSPISLEDEFFKVSKAGHLIGLRGIQQGLALNVKPYITAAAGESDEDGTFKDSEVGLDIKWGITKGLGLDVTLNTDFAETEVDTVQVNLTRFSLFFPEKREFFLENSGIFEFGTPGGRGGPLFRLFYSRRIGISEEGSPVSLEWGTRVAGKVGRWNLGLIQAHTGSLTTEEEAVPKTDWTTVRVEREVGSRSSVGILATLKDPAANETSSTYGVDWTVRPTNRLSLWGFGAASDNPDSETGLILGSGVEWENRVWELSASYMDVDEEFEPSAGLLRRNDVRRLAAETSYQPRPKSERIRNYEFELKLERYERHDGSVESEELQFTFFGLETENDFQFTIFAQFHQEGLTEEFEIYEGVIIPEGHYNFQDLVLFFETNQSRTFSLRGFFIEGEFYDGRRLRASVTGNWRPSRFLNSETTWNRTAIDLPGGDFVTNVIRQRFGASFTPDLSLSTLVQYNDVDEEMGLNLRLNWIYKPGADLFVVYNETLSAPNGLSNLESKDRRITVKFTYLFQR